MDPRLVALVVAFAVTLVAVYLLLAAAHRRGMLAPANHERWGRREVPTVGGIGLLAGIVAAGVIAPGLDVDRAAVLLAAAVAALLGLADDLGTVPPRRRLVIQGTIGLVLGAILGRDLGVGLPALALLGVVAVVTLANCTNLVDNSDGLAASLTTVSAATLAALAAAAGLGGSAPVLGLAVAGAALGFLVWNRPPARIFMGDVGSLMLGTALAGTSLLLLADAAATPAGPWLVLLALPVPFVVQGADVALVVVSRLRRGADPMRGGVDHTSHRLLRAGLGPWSMLAAVVIPAIAFGLVIVAAVATGDVRVVVVVSAGVIALALLGEVLLARRLPYEPAPSVGATPVQHNLGGVRLERETTAPERP
jgi:UDP-N-acetylmuramyl pentapeptide phosphotransferase/UDP-N-acetylglucosamine-1-phosphate transferase